MQRSNSKFRLPQVGLTMIVPRRSYFAWKLAKYGAYEPNNTNWIISNIQSQAKGIIVDVGANFGWYSCILGKTFPHLTIIAFEPEPAAFSLLKKNIASSGCKNIHAIQSGVGAESGTMDLYVSGGDNSGLHSALPIKDFSKIIKINVATLDNLLADFSGTVEFLKIDVEGFEFNVLNGAEKTLRRTKKLMFEFTPNALEKLGFSPKELLLKIQGLGFSIYYINDFNNLVPLPSVEECQTVTQWRKDMICINDALKT